MRSSCFTCGQAVENVFVDDYCAACKSVTAEAEQGFKAEHPEASSSDILYAGRQARAHRAHHANRNYIDPRGFAANRGTLPQPPQK